MAMQNNSTPLFLYALGDNRCGQGGVGGEELLSSPVRCDPSKLDGREIYRIVANGNQCFVVLFNGTVLSAGENENEELCRPGKKSIFHRIDMLETFKVVDVAAGEGFFHILCQNGQVLSYGKNDMGQLGTGNRDFKDKPRINVNIKEKLIQISCGLHHTVALTKGGQVLTWGGNRKGQLGDGQLTSSITPIPLAQLMHRPVISIACGEYHTVVLTSGGNVYSWGANDNGQLGQGDTTARLRPELIRTLRANKCILIACGRNHTLFVSANHLLFSTGSNTHGQCGQELAFRQILSPSVVEYFREKTTLEISCGALHSFVVAAPSSNILKRRLYVMGSNACGQLGIESSASTEYPQVSRFNAAQIDAIFTSPLSLTTHILTHEDLTVPAMNDSGSIEEADIGNHHLRRKLLPSVNADDILQMLHRLPKDPASVAPNQRSTVDQLVREIRETISAAFASISVLNASFLPNSSGSSIVANSFLCVDLYSVRRAYEGILAVESSYPVIAVTLGRTLVHICDELKHCPFDDAETLSVFFILLENPLLLRTGEYHIVLEKLVHSILSLPKALREELFKRMKAYPSEYFGRVVHVMMNFLHYILTNKIAGLDSTPVIFVLETLYKCSREMDNIIPYQHFYHPTLPKVINLLQEWQRFQESRAQQLTNVVNYWQYPFLINEGNKFHVLQYEYQRRRLAYVHLLSNRYDVTNVLRHLQLQQQQQLQHPTPSNDTNNYTDAPPSRDGESLARQLSSQLQAYLPVGLTAILTERVTSSLDSSSVSSPSSYSVSLVFQIQVRRTCLLEDMRQLLSSVLHSDPDVLWLPLKVIFEGEIGEDVGGLTKELFTLLIRHLMQDSGAFSLGSSGQSYWFRRNNAHDLDEAQPVDKNLVSWEYMLGLVVSLAMYHGVHIDVPLPNSMFKLLKGKELSLSDLWAADRDLAQGLKLLMQYPDGITSIEDAFGVTFVASVNPLLDHHSNTLMPKRTIPLVINGEAKIVTRGNRGEFVHEFVQHALYKSCQTAIDEYLSGLKRLIGDDIWLICSHEELEAVVEGMSLNEPLTALRLSTAYAGPHFHDKHPVIEWFWEIVSEFTLVQKKQFLLFVSGSERAPIGGLSHLVLTIQSSEQDGNSLPSSRTCFNLLFLSRHYASKEAMREKLLTAIEHSQGFGLV